MNGELLMDALGGETSFADVHGEGVGFVPACTLGVGQKARLTYGQNVDSLKFFTTCGLQEGYEVKYFLNVCKASQINPIFS